MACNKTIATYANSCDKVTVAGVQSLYLISYGSLTPLSGTTEVYAIGVNEMVNEIGATGSTKFAKIGILPKAVALTDNHTFDPTTGIGEYTEGLVLPVNNISTEARKLVKSLVGQPVTALVKLVSGQFVSLGLDGMMYVTGVDGSVDGSTNGYTITFSGNASDFPFIVDPTIIAGLVA